MAPGLGMYTRLTGSALNGSRECCTLKTNSALAFGVSATSPSTPAVRRPALRSVTRRTLISVFERDRSINFCNRRTLGRSPALDAVKIRCRNRRTFRSACRQSTWRQSSMASSGPLTVMVSSLSSGSGVIVIFLFTGSPDRVSALSRPATRADIRPVIHAPPAGGLAIRTRFPAAFRPPAFASRSSCSRRGVGPSSRSAYRPTTGPRRGYRVPHARAATGVGALYTPRTAVLIPTDRGSRPAPAASQRPVPAPDVLPINRVSLNEASTRVHAIHPSGLPLACGHPDGTGRPWALRPGLRTPPTRSRTAHARMGTGHRARTWNYRSTHIRCSPIR